MPSNIILISYAVPRAHPIGCIYIEALREGLLNGIGYRQGDS